MPTSFPLVAARVKEILDCSRPDAQEVTSAVIRAMREVFAEERILSMPKFGKLTVYCYKMPPGVIKIHSDKELPEYYGQVKFKASPHLKQGLNAYCNTGNPEPPRFVKSKGK